jgi:hypothetical protein
MRRKPPTWDQPTLFPIKYTDSPEPANPVISTIEGDDNALQDNRSRTLAGADGVARTTAADAPASADTGNLLAGIEVLTYPEMISRKPAHLSLGTRSMKITMVLRTIRKRLQG